MNTATKCKHKSCVRVSDLMCDALEGQRDGVWHDTLHHPVGDPQTGADVTCGASQFPQCSEPKQWAWQSWTRVHRLCADIGSRMCTFKELYNGVASGTGGGGTSRKVA